MPFTCFPVVPAKCLASQFAMQNQQRFIICGILFLKGIICGIASAKRIQEYHVE
jgi:hypothetical protein